MRAVPIMLAVAFALSASPAAAQKLEHLAPSFSRAKPIIGLPVAAVRIEMFAVTRNARADTPLRRAHLDDCETMAKVIPGYPQPAFVSLDFRINF